MKTKITLFLLLQVFCLNHINAQCSGVDFEEQNGIAILEMESKSNSGFKNEAFSGASNGRTLAYRGSDSFNNPGSSTLTYSVRITSPGTYRFVWRNKIGIIASSNASTEHNDAWLKINASNFYGQRGSGRVYPGGSGKSPVAEGSTSGGWFKVYTNTIDWSYTTNTSDFDAHAIYASFNSAGTYTIQVSGRSKGHFIDRMVLYKESMYSSTQAQSLSRGQTNCSGGTPPPPPPPPTPPADNVSPVVTFTNISNNQVFDLGDSVTIALNASDSDGTVVKHEIFVNGSLVDTDGLNYSPYQLVFNQLTNYTVKTSVTDNDGAVTSNTVALVIEGDGSTPPPVPPGDNASPMVGFTNISNNQVFDLGDRTSIALNAGDSDGTIVKYEIFVNGSLVDTDGLDYTPYLLVFNQLGSYTVKASVTDNDGAVTSNTVTLVVEDDGSTPPPAPPGDNASPMVGFTNISNNQVFDLGDSVSIALNAGDSDGTVVKYEIFVNGSLVDTDGLDYTPYPLVFNQLGNYAVKVFVTDNDGAITSETITLIVGEDTPPTPPTPSENSLPNVSFVNLTNGENFSVGETITVNLNASDADGSIVKHQIFVNNNLVDTDGVLFTPYLINNAQVGDFTINATVTDNEGAIVSKIITVKVSDGSSSPLNTAPTVAFLSPIDGQVLTIGSDVIVNLNASDTDGSIVKYQIFINNRLVDTDGANFTPYVINNLKSGTYDLRAEVTDNEGTVSSASIVVSAGGITGFKLQAYNVTEATYVYPNPIFSDEILTIQLNEKSNAPYDYSVISTAGAQVGEGSFLTIDGQAEIDFNIPSWVKGVYYVKVFSAGKIIETIPLIRK
ncbi:Ig-like domain-containing protein [Maribacter antarcticus]|uniref:Ig-like domain-containing protein n=1 Tax=Maribacter antarcticus TaxID=505250 RepID=UPI00047AFDDC|nr:Ig-like domain-containing protein [Maribacter antarcticus]